MNKPMIRFHNTQTDEIIDREMTNEELEIWSNNQTVLLEENEKQLQKENARESALAKLGALGLTPEEIAAL